MGLVWVLGCFVGFGFDVLVVCGVVLVGICVACFSCWLGWLF